MAEETDPQSAKKHRVIHWNPDAGQETAKRRWPVWKILAVSVGGFFGVLVAAGIVIRVIKLVAGPQVFQSAPAGNVASSDPSTEFVSQSKAQLAHENANRALVELRRMPLNHDVQIQRLIMIEKAFAVGENILATREPALAYQHFDALNREIDDFTKSIKMKQEAQQAHDALQLKFKELDGDRGLIPEAWESALADAATGGKFLTDGSFNSANKAFTRAADQLKKIEKAISTSVDDAMRRGQEALGKGDRDVAIKSFNQALAKSPGNELAAQGLKRAEKIERVHALLLQADDFEKQSKFAEAAEAYDKAFALDAFSAVAQQGATRAKRLQKENQFNTAWTAAKAAYQGKNWKVAITEGQNALKVEPKKAEVEKLVKDARDNEHKEAVDKSVARAFAFENEHQWKEAKDAYSETLTLEPENVDAKDGFIRSGRMIRTLLEYNTKLEIAEERSKHADFQTAIKVFNEAMNIKPSYLPVTEKMQQLRTSLLQQNKPVKVTFKGDGKTWISISNYRMLGPIENPEQVNILPGDYEIVGRRKGYQDVQMILQIRNGTPVPDVVVICQYKNDK